MQKHHIGFTPVLLAALFLTSAVALADEAKSPGRVILYSFDGAAFDRLHSYMQEPTWPKTGIIEMYDNGLQVERTSATDPTLTASSHTSIHAGAYPDKHGVVSNSFHLPGTPISKGISGFVAKFETTAIWEEARRAGKRVGVLSFPGADSKVDDDYGRRGDWGIYYHSSEASSFVYSATAALFNPISKWDSSISYSEPRWTPVIWREKKNSAIDGDDNDKQERTLFLIVLDRKNDKTVNYDSVVWDSDLDLSNGTLTPPMRLGQWGEVTFLSNGIKKTAWTKLFDIASDLSSLKIYVGPLHHVEAYPESFRKAVEENVGVWPGEPDRAISELIDTEAWIEQSMRLSNYLLKLFTFAVKTQEWDLLIGYQPIVDEFGHKMLLIDPRQPGYSEDNERENDLILRRAYLQMNNVVSEMMQLKGENTALVIVSDHGMHPIWQMAYPNRLLKENGYIHTDGHEDGNGIIPLRNSEAIINDGTYKFSVEINPPQQPTTDPNYQSIDGDPIVANETMAKAFASGGCAHLYLNVKGREKDGIIPKPGDGKQYSQIRDKIKKLFLEWKANGEPVFEQVLTREEAASLHLDHPNSGDLVMIATPGTHLKSEVGGEGVVETANFLGQHGFLSSHPSMRPALFAVGPGIPNKEVKFMHNVEIAPMVKRLLNIK